MSLGILSRSAFAIALVSAIVMLPVVAAESSGHETLAAYGHIELGTVHVDFQARLHYSISVTDGAGIRLMVLDESNFIAWRENLSYTQMPSSSAVTTNTTVDANLDRGNYHIVAENPTAQPVSFTYALGDMAISDTSAWLPIGVAATIVAAVLLGARLLRRWSLRKPPAPGPDFCESCGEDMPADATECPHCGEKRE